jgi:5'-3' exonuclease
VNKRPPKNGKKVEIHNILVIDGNALYKTGYFGAKDQYTRDGKHVGGLYQFITVTRKLLSEHLYHKVIVCWDGNFSGKLRWELYSDYKSGRGKDYVNGTEPDPEERLQRLMVQQYLDELYVRQIQDEIVESDDFIAYICNNKKENEAITICTTDRDLAQLIQRGVRIYFCDQKIKNYVTVATYNMFFDHHVDNVALIKTICGDNSDSIKGIKGVKEKTLLNLFPEIKERKVTLNEIIERAKEQQQDRLNQKKKPLAALTNIINGITDGIQGDKIYEINDKLVNLKKPLMTEQACGAMDELLELPLAGDRSIKNAYTFMKRDGLDQIIGEWYGDYLMPFKKLMEREKKHQIIT